MAMKPVALFFWGIMFFLLLVYCGLYAAEKGILEILALQKPAEAFYFKLDENKITIIFAGKDYSVEFK